MKKSYEQIFGENRVSWLYEIARSDVSPSAVKIGLLFATFAAPGQRETLSPTYRWIAENAQVSRATLARALNELEEKGYLEIYREDGHRNGYCLPFDGEAVWGGPKIKGGSQN